MVAIDRVEAVLDGIEGDWCDSLANCSSHDVEKLASLVDTVGRLTVDDGPGKVQAVITTGKYIISPAMDFD